MPLRTRMLVVIVVLLAIGLGLAGFVTYRILSASLIDRVDDQLKAAVRPAADRLSAPTQTHPGEHGLFLPEGSYAALLDQSGRVRREARFAFGQPAPRPRIPSNVVRPQAGMETLQ